jgi:hypothetical protein
VVGGTNVSGEPAASITYSLDGNRHWENRRIVGIMGGEV